MTVYVKYKCAPPSLRVRTRCFQAETIADMWKKIPEHLNGRLISIRMVMETVIEREKLPAESVAELERLAGVTTNAVS